MPDETDPTPSDINVIAGVTARQIVSALAGAGLLSGSLLQGRESIVVILASVLALVINWILARSKAFKLRAAPPVPPPGKDTLPGGTTLVLLVCSGTLVGGCASWYAQHPTQQVNSIRQTATKVIENLATYRALGKIDDDEYRQISGLIETFDARLETKQWAADQIKTLEDQLAATTDPGARKQIQALLDVDRANFNQSLSDVNVILDELLLWQARVHAKQ